MGNTQNEGLNTHLWKVLNSKVEGSGKITSIVRIDKKYRKNILKPESTIFFPFEKVPCSWGEKEIGKEQGEGRGFGSTQPRLPVGQ